MKGRTWVYYKGEMYEKGTGSSTVGPSMGPFVIPDVPDFVSPIDKTVVKGRAGIRDHCARHDVVPTQELAGLPVGHQRVAPNREQIRQDIIKVMHQKGYWNGSS
jgi:hypothetical protein